MLKLRIMESENCCVVCYNSLDPKYKVNIPCDHEYCINCFIKHMRIDHRCAICRSALADPLTPVEPSTDTEYITSGIYSDAYIPVDEILREDYDNDGINIPPSNTLYNNELAIVYQQFSEPLEGHDVFSEANYIFSAIKDKFDITARIKRELISQIHNITEYDDTEAKKYIDVINNYFSIDYNIWSCVYDFVEFLYEPRSNIINV